MAASPSSGSSSPLSDAGSPPESWQDSNATPTAAAHGVTALAPPYTNGAIFMSPLSDGDRRSQRSPTSSTAERAESDLTDMSDDDDDDEHEERGDEEGRGEVDLDDGEGVAPPSELAEGTNGTYEASVSSSQSLSPAPSSTERKPKPLPHIVLNVKQAQDQSVASSRDSQADSDLGSITDSNGDDGDLEPSGKIESRPNADPGGNGTAGAERDVVTNGGEASGDDEEEAVDGEDEVAEDEEDGDGDVTMRAVDGLQALADGAGALANGDGPPTDDGAMDATIETEVGRDAGEEVDAEDGDADEQAEQGEPEVQDQEQENGEAELEEEEAEASPAPSIQPFRPHSTHAPPPTTAAMKALLSLEIKFAALRDRLYVERMEETAAEEEMILDGSHPALSFMFKNLSARRERLHEVASRRHRQVLDELAKVREEEKECVWTWWTEERDREQWEEFEQTWAKRRRLIREKSELDASPKRPKPVPKSWADQPRPLDWAAGAVPSALSARDAAADLALMAPTRQQGNRQPSSPSLYGFTSNPPTTYYQHSHVPHTVQPEPVYASRVPIQHPQTAANAPTSMPRQGPVPPQGTYGNAVFNAEPRREGRTVPTTSGLFDTARRPPSNELPNHPGPSHAQPVPQMPPTHTTAGAGGESRPLEPWNNPAYENPTNGVVTLDQHPSLKRSANTAVAPAPAPSVPTQAAPPTTAVPSTVKEETSVASTTAEPQNDRFRQVYPNLSNYVSRTPPQHTSPAQRLGALSPPKSSLGITGVPTPFI